MVEGADLMWQYWYVTLVLTIIAVLIIARHFDKRQSASGMPTWIICERKAKTSGRSATSVGLPRVNITKGLMRTKSICMLITNHEENEDTSRHCGLLRTDEGAGREECEL